MHTESRRGSQFLSNSFRGEPAAAKKLNQLNVDAIECSFLESMRRWNACVKVFSGDSEHESSFSVSVAGKPRSGRRPGLVGQMNASKQKLAIVEKKASDSKPKGRSGAAHMRDAADLVMEQDCLEIAQALSNSSKNGQIQSAKFLYELSEQNEKAGEDSAARKVRSMALELANAPQWTGGWPEEKHNGDDETATDS
jgi:hypothetical protein